MNTLRSVKISALTSASVISLMCLVSSAQSQVIVIEDFEVNEGRLTADPNTGSGTSQGFFKAAPGVPGTAVRVTTNFFDGIASQQIILDDDPSVAGAPSGLGASDSWRLRHLSGGGTPANNLSLSIPAGGTSFVGYWIRTSSPGLDAGIGVDDGLALEIGRWQPVPADGLWHLIEWRIQDAVDWDGFAGTGANGSIESATVTIDSLFFRGGNGFGTGTDFDANFFVDRVAYNPTGSLVPEPSSIGLFLISGLIPLKRRRRPN